MKKIISLALILVLCVVLCACGSTNNASSNTITQNTNNIPMEVVTTEENSSNKENSSELVDGMRPDFKSAMDSYEAFYDEYYEFMVEYKKNPTDLTLLSKYGELMIKVAEMDASFEAWDENEMNDAELKYYLEVTNRIMQKLVDIAA